MRTGGRLLRFESKIKTRAGLAAVLRRRRADGERIVFTNGCFDIMHYGHVSYLESAAEKGDVLVVGVNSDSSVRRLKGPKRPLNRQEFRAGVLAGLASVDYVVIFDEDTPLELIKSLKPDVLVKGGDWKVRDIVGSKEVMVSGGKVFSIKFVPGFSTTSLIEKIAKSIKI